MFPRVAALRASPAWYSIRSNLPPLGADPHRPWWPAQLGEEEWLERYLLELSDKGWAQVYGDYRLGQAASDGFISTGDAKTDAMLKQLLQGASHG